MAIKVKWILDGITIILCFCVSTASQNLTCHMFSTGIATHHNKTSASCDRYDHCVIVKYHTAVTDEKTDYYCDSLNYCDGQTTDDAGVHVWHEVGWGVIYCCNSDMCNDEEKSSGLKLEDPQLSCFKSVSESEKDPNKEKCVASHCYNITGPDKKVIYDCDEKAQHCKNKRNDRCVEDSQNSTVCCCSSDGCNMPLSPASTPSPSTSRHETMLPTRAFIPNIEPSTPLVPMDNDSMIDGSSKKHWIFVIGIVAASMLGILVFVVMAIMIKKIRRRHLTDQAFTYAQLTEDLNDTDATDSLTAGDGQTPRDDTLIVA